MFLTPPPRVLRGRTRTKAVRASLEGAWTGEYGYDALPRASVPFNATLEEIEGALTGWIDEPNTFGHPGARRLYARIDGARRGSEVRFTKTYDGVGGVRHAVLYQGEANAAFTRIDGVWSAGGARGPFYMTRWRAAEDADEIEGETEAEARA